MIYVYAVLPPHTHLPSLEGLEGAPIAAREAAGLTLAVSEHETVPEPAKEAVLRHADVVEALAEAGAAVLPARFGLAFRDEAALQEGVAAQAAALRAALERVEGCAEVGLRVLGPDREEPETELRGGDYLRARSREKAVRERLASELHDVLTRHARASTVAASAGGPLLLRAAYLVPREGIEAFRREVGELERSHPELALVCSGPWPPYSFAPRAEALT